MRRCRRCGEENHFTASFCATCGLALTAADGDHLLAGPSDGDENLPGRSSEYVSAPSFGETSPPVPPSSDTADPTTDRREATPAPTGQPAAAVPTSVVPAAGGFSDATTIRGGSAPGDGSGSLPPGPPDGRSTNVMVAALAVAIVVIVGGIFVLLASSSGGDDGVTTDADDPAPSVAVGQATTVLPEAAPATPDTSSAPEPTSTDPSAPASTVAPTPAPTSPPDPIRSPGDLGLVQPILNEPCDGRFITFVGSAVGDEPYPDVVSSLLARYPGSNYIWTRSCPSLRQEFRNGNDIYGVVFGPYLTRQEACDAVSFGPPDAYVRRISTIDPPDHTVEC